jgi:hypothetical protein
MLEYILVQYCLLSVYIACTFFRAVKSLKSERSSLDLQGAMGR